MLFKKVITQVFEFTEALKSQHNPGFEFFYDTFIQEFHPCHGFEILGNSTRSGPLHYGTQVPGVSVPLSSASAGVNQGPGACMP